MHAGICISNDAHLWVVVDVIIWTESADFFLKNSWITNVSYKYYFFNAFKTYNKNNYNYGIMDATGGCKICTIGVQCHWVN